MTSGLLAASLFILFAGAGGAMAQAPATPASPAQPAASSVGIIAGGADGTGVRIASDLSRLLDGNDLRVIPMIGKGSIQDINDLLTLKSADIAILPSDVMARAAAADRQSGMQSRIKYVAKLYSEEFHVLSRMQFMCLADLNGRRVGFGPQGSGPAVTAQAVFEANGISPEPLYLEREEAIERLKRGELDALVYVGGKPSHAFDSISHKDKVHFLDVEYLPPLQVNYLPAIITPEDYPNLVAPNESVATVGVSYVMAIHDQPPQSERFRVMSRFAEKFLSGFDRLKGPGFSPKWNDVNLRAPVKGWQRFEPAAQWLAAAAQPVPQAAPERPAAQMKTMLLKFVESQKGASSDQEELFNRFVLWYREYGVQAPQLR
jgi:TRAP transporter TAXI family solute receptor